MTVSETQIEAAKKAIREELQNIGYGVGTINAEQLSDALARAALTAALFDQASGWQDISTAPKDGRAFLASSEGWMTVCHWHRHHQCWSAVGPSYSRYAFNEQPTHWQPLPAPPPSSTAGEVR